MRAGVGALLGLALGIVLGLATLTLVQPTLVESASASPPDFTLSLSELVVAPDGSSAGYDRDALFGDWASVCSNGDTRDLILARDVTEDEVRGECDVVAGVLMDPYDGSTYVGPTRELDVDHVYPLALAYRTGAASWTQERREELANDPANLVTTQAATNRGKGDDGPEDWLPVANRCGYAQTFVHVARTYGLTVTAERRDALAGAC